MKIILIHGNGGSTAGDVWYPWLEREVRSRLPVINQTFPDNVKARAGSGCHSSRNSAPRDYGPVGHSSGAVAAMRYAETHRILGSILVGGAKRPRRRWRSGERLLQAPWQWD